MSFGTLLDRCCGCVRACGGGADLHWEALTDDGETWWRVQGGLGSSRYDKKSVVAIVSRVELDSIKYIGVKSIAAEGGRSLA